jgi:quercetin dioxygenase-like cupin family protein
MNAMRWGIATLMLSQAALTQTPARPVPVRDEPRHKVVFENQYVRIIDVQIQPGEVTAYHVHEIPSVVVYLTKSSNRSQSWGESTFLSRDTTPGDSRFVAYDEKPLTHRVTNTGTTFYRVFDIELMRKAADAAPCAPPPQAEVAWQEKLVRSSNVRLEPGARAEFGANPCAHLLIGIHGKVTTATDAGGALAKRPLGHGDYQFVSANARFEIGNDGTAKADIVLLQLR